MPSPWLQERFDAQEDELAKLRAEWYKGVNEDKAVIRDPYYQATLRAKDRLGNKATAFVLVQLDTVAPIITPGLYMFDNVPELETDEDTISLDITGHTTVRVPSGTGFATWRITPPVSPGETLSYTAIVPRGISRNS